MKSAVSKRVKTSKQRGFWLRCFLDGAGKLLLLIVLVCGAAHAQPDISGPIHLTHVEGVVVNSVGKPVANAEVLLVRDEAVAYRTRTDSRGAFSFSRVSGRYWFRVARSEYAPAAKEVQVGAEIATYLQRKKLYVIVGPGACMDECSSVFTSKHDFDRAIRQKSRH